MKESQKRVSMDTQSMIPGFNPGLISLMNLILSNLLFKKYSNFEESAVWNRPCDNPLGESTIEWRDGTPEVAR